MEFFEFFFTGPGWGWRALVLLLMVGSVTDMISSIFKSRSLEQERDHLLEIVQEYIKKEKDNPATKDDVRS